MNYAYEHRDLFTVDGYVYAHCISSDFVMGAGIAKLFTNRGIKQRLLNTYPVNNWNGHGYCLPIFTKNHVVCNLVTKHKVYEKPTYDTLRSALVHMKLYCNLWKIKKLAMPRIGCGLDKLQWDKVKSIIEKVFANTDIEILVCNI